MIKAIFFDVDGTLVSLKTHTIPQSTLDSLQALRKKGIKLFISSGRHMEMLDEVREQFDFDGYITVNGQFCLCGERVIRSNPIPREGMAEIVRAMEEHGFSGIFMEGEEFWTPRRDETVEWFLRMFPVIKTLYDRPLSRALERQAYQVVVLLSPEEEWKLMEHAEHLGGTRWHPGFVDTVHPEGGKDAGIRAVLDWTGIAPEEAMAFGDGGNDLTMFSCVGIGVAMGNADDTVKDAADYVTAHVDEDGITAALKHFNVL